MKRAAQRPLIVLSILALLSSAAMVLISDGRAYAHTNCNRGVNPCIDVHTIPIGNLYGTVYVDGVRFAPYDYVAVSYWTDGNAHPYVGVYTDSSGKFSVTIPPHCAYSWVGAMASSVWGEAVSNYDYVNSIC